MRSSTMRRSTCGESRVAIRGKHPTMRSRAHRSTLGAGLLAALALALAACGAAAQGPGGSHPPVARSAAAEPCGTAAAGVLGRAAGQVATRIYAGELAGTETRSDQHQVETNAALLSAVAGGERAAITRAVTTLVYSHTHIVRLRVTSGSAVLADVGGPYILAPVGGALRLHGRTIGHYALSVQDDLGYVKLVTRFIGAPLVMRTGSRAIPVEGLFAGAPASIPNRGPVKVSGMTYEAFSFAAAAFPSGPLRVSLLLPVSAGLAGESCTAIRSAELGRVAQRISRRFSLSQASFSTYIKLAASVTGGLLYVRSGSRELAGSTPRPGPARLPGSGTVAFHGATYTVYSFQAPSSAGSVRVYQLIKA
jgi:hypothetical protein